MPIPLEERVIAHDDMSLNTSQVRAPEANVLQGSLCLLTDDPLPSLSVEKNGSSSVHHCRAASLAVVFVGLSRAPFGDVYIRQAIPAAAHWILELRLI